MQDGSYQPLVHRTALATTLVALLPIAVGALVTTMGAGMAFRDWPSSDGHSMLAYPWLASAGDKFVEHGHRLAGMLVGVFSIALAGVMFWKEPRRWVMVLGVLVLLGVIGQGILGGLRVLEDRPDLAMIHGNFAACVFCLMAAVTLVTSRGWIEQSVAASGWREPAGALNSPGGLHPPLAGRDVSFLKLAAFMTVIAVYAQYILGGRQRHLHDMLHEHVAGAVVASMMVLAMAAVALRSRIEWLRRPAYALLLLLLVQVALGAGSWITKFGLASTGYMAVQGSTLQLVIRSGHTVTGMLLLMTSVILLLRIVRVANVARAVANSLASVPVSSGRLTAEGGAG